MKCISCVITESSFLSGSRFFKFLIVCFLIALVNVGCGSGGGGGGGDGEGGGGGESVPDNPVTPISYTGSTNQAVISTGNAAYIAIGGLQGGAPGTGNSGLGTASINVSAEWEQNYPRLLTLSRTLERSVRNIDSAPLHGEITVSVEYSDIQTRAGECGGMAYYSIRYDDDGNVSGTDTYVDYCNDGVTVSGGINYSGRKTSIYSNEYLELSISFGPFQIVDADGTFTTQGTIDYDYTVSPVAVTMDLLMNCSCDGKIYRYENFTMTLTEGYNYIDFEMNGRFYEPDYGYLDISTVETFRVHDNASWPDRGEFVFTGNSGTMARFIILSDTEYAVEVDTDGDGFYDWSKIVSWVEDPGDGHTDQTSPTVPSGLIVNAISDSEIMLSWTEPSDNIGVRGYRIYRDGAYLMTATDSSASDTGLSYFTQYCYTISAVDAMGNESLQSSQSCEMTEKAQFSLFPLSPTGLTATATSHHQITLLWTGPYGIEGFDGYKIYRNGEYLEPVDNNRTGSYEESLYPGTNYCYAVSAYYGSMESELTSQVCVNTDEEINVNALFIENGQFIHRSGRSLDLGDVDSDGDLDAFIAGGTFVMLNDGGGKFYYSGQSLEGTDGEDVALRDLDRDGDLDAFVVYGNSKPNRVWMNDGNGVFSDSSQRLGVLSSKGVALGDLDGDGDLDAFVANDNNNPNKVWINDGNSIFSDSGQSLGVGYSEDIALGDLDGDGDLDAFVANYNNEPNKVWINDGNGNFSDSGQSLGSRSSKGVSIGDLDGDGDLDAVVTNYFAYNTIWLNDGNGNYTVTDQELYNSLGSAASALGDLDNDGDLDLVHLMSVMNDRAYLNDGNANMTGISTIGVTEWGTDVSMGDLDDDGDLDVFFTSRDQSMVWINTSRKR